MDAYDIFKKLTKGLTFRSKILGVKKEIKPVPEITKIEIGNSKLPNLIDEDEFKIENFLNAEEKPPHSGEQEEYELKLTSDLTVTESGVKKKNKRRRSKKVSLQKQTATELEEARHRRSEHGIRVVGQEPAAPLKDFFSLMDTYGVPQSLVDNLIQCGYMEPTPIQRQAIPCMLENRQILACAPTGSGKTAAFVLPLLHMLKSPSKGPRSLVLCPTRELAKQTYREALRLSAGTNLSINFVPKISQDKIESQRAKLRKTDLLISTPNRLCYLLDQDSSPINLDNIKWLVVDEADKLFEGSDKNESDFRPQLEKVMNACGTDANLSLFSATQTPIVVDWCRRNMDQLLCITVGQRNAATELVEQELLYVGSESGKLVAFRQLVQQGLKPPVLVFVQSKDRAKQLFKELLYDGINVDVIHADRTQLQRDNVVKSFRMGKIWVLICTELMGRGIDFRGVNLVINYDFPPSSISYVHRIGRAGRAGQKGRAVTFFTQDDIPNLKSIIVVMKQSGCEVPEFMLTLKQTRKNRKSLLKFAPKREDISTELPERRGWKRKSGDSDDKKTMKKRKVSDDGNGHMKEPRDSIKTKPRPNKVRGNIPENMKKKPFGKNKKALQAKAKKSFKKKDH